MRPNTLYTFNTVLKWDLSEFSWQTDLKWQRRMALMRAARMRRRPLAGDAGVYLGWRAELFYLPNNLEMTQRQREQRRDKTWQQKTSSMFQMQLLNVGEGLKSRHADATVHVHPLSFSMERIRTNARCKLGNPVHSWTYFWLPSFSKRLGFLLFCSLLWCLNVARLNITQLKYEALEFGSWNGCLGSTSLLQNLGRIY